MTPSSDLGDLFDPPKCGRCGGTGRVRYRYGVPGQDTHTPASKIVWQDEGYERTCPVCHGTGIGKHRYNGPPKWIDFDEHGSIINERLIRKDKQCQKDRNDGTPGSTRT